MNKDPFLHYIWKTAVGNLSCAAIGNLVKALWKFAETGEKTDLTGGERVIFAMCMDALHNGEARQ